MRLTEKDECGNWNLRNVRWEELRAGATITEVLAKRLYGALWKLMEYEDVNDDPKKLWCEKAKMQTTMASERDWKNREDFVEDLGALLSRTRAGVSECVLNRDDTVTIFFDSGYSKRVSVECDSYLAIIDDVCCELRG